MAFPASSQALANAYSLIKGRALGIKSETQQLRAASAAGPISAERIIGYSAMLARSKTELATLAATPGLQTYAQAQENNPLLDIAAEYNAMVSQINSVIAWIAANFPQDGAGYKLAFQMDADGGLVWRQFTTASLATFRTQLDALTATIA